MAIIKLTDTTWLNQESIKVESVLRANHALGGKEGKDGKDASTLKAMLNYAGLDYENADLLTIKNKLIADGIIEETGSAKMSSPGGDWKATTEMQEIAEIEPQKGWASRLVSRIKEKFGR